MTTRRSLRARCVGQVFSWVWKSLVPSPLFFHSYLFPLLSSQSCPFTLYLHFVHSAFPILVFVPFSPLSSQPFPITLAASFPCPSLTLSPLPSQPCPLILAPSFPYSSLTPVLSPLPSAAGHQKLGSPWGPGCLPHDLQHLCHHHRLQLRALRSRGCHYPPHSR